MVLQPDLDATEAEDVVTADRSHSFGQIILANGTDLLDLLVHLLLSATDLAL